jgi:thiol-disulfide isomerase/thioredoxin
MKRLLFLLPLSVILFNSCRTITPAAQTSTTVNQVETADQKPAGVNYSEQTTWILGYFTPDRLTGSVHSDWYMKGKDDYQPNTEALNKLLDISKDQLTIKIVMGTWCPDSRREVPRFMRVMDIWQFPYAKITFIGVDNAKLSPVGEYDKLGIQRVPTFIIYKNNIEAGRIIENPLTSLEQDIVNILTRNE